MLCGFVKSAMLILFISYLDEFHDLKRKLCKPSEEG